MAVGSKDWIIICVDPSAPQRTANMNPQVNPTSAQKVYDNSLILGEILKKVEKKKDLINCMITSKAAFVPCVNIIYREVDWTCVTGMAGRGCNLVGCDSI